MEVVTAVGNRKGIYQGEIRQAGERVLRRGASSGPSGVGPRGLGPHVQGTGTDEPDVPRRRGAQDVLGPGAGTTQTAGCIAGGLACFGRPHQQDVRGQGRSTRRQTVTP